MLTDNGTVVFIFLRVLCLYFLYSYPSYFTWYVMYIIRQRYGRVRVNLK
jgi:dolichol kinase